MSYLTPPGHFICLICLPLSVRCDLYIITVVPKSNITEEAGVLEDEGEGVPEPPHQTIKTDSLHGEALFSYFPPLADMHFLT